MYSARVLAFVAVLVGLAHSFPWDIVMAGEKQLEFFYNGTVTHTEDIPSAHFITVVMYDPVHYRVLYVDYNSAKISINSFDLTTKKMQTLFTRVTSTDYYTYLAYESVTKLLFWTEDKKIYSISLKPASSNEAVDVDLLVTSDRKFSAKCGAIAVDSCGGYIYWATDYNIERAAFDGSGREVLLDGRVTRRWNLAIDQQTETMYWIEETIANQYSIESADLNGKNRRTFYLIGAESYASGLFVSKDFIYWRSYDQRAIMQMPKNQKRGVGPDIYSYTTGDRWWCQITAANYTIEEQILGNNSCEALKSLILDVEERHGSICHNYCFQGNCKVSAEGHPKCSCNRGYSGERCEVDACHKHCFNDGVCSLNKAEKPVCQCSAGYQGERCDESICKDYCLHGNCTLSTEGQRTCRCDAGYSGERCEVNACHEHCLNNGDCSLNEEDEPVCQCTADYGGERCEVSVRWENCVRAEGQPNSGCSAGNSGEKNVNACHQYCLNDGVCSLNEDSEPVCKCTGDYEGDRCDVPAFLIKCFLYAYKNSPPVTLSKGVKSTCAATVV